MNLLLDTHVLLWWLTHDERLPERMRVAVAEEESEVFVSAASTWEMSIKSAVGKLTLPDGLREQLQQQGFRAPWTTVWLLAPYLPTTTTRPTACSSRRPPGEGCSCSASIDVSATTTSSSCSRPRRARPDEYRATCGEAVDGVLVSGITARPAPRHDVSSPLVVGTRCDCWFGVVIRPVGGRLPRPP